MKNELIDNGFNFSDLKMKNFETGKKFVAAENEKFLKMLKLQAVENLKNRILQRGKA